MLSIFDLPSFLLCSFFLIESISFDLLANSHANNCMLALLSEEDT